MTDATFLFLQPQNFDAFVFDTDDLSTLRGSSLTLLRAPDLLLGWLQSQALRVEVVQNAASELLVELRKDLAESTTEDAGGLTPMPEQSPEPKLAARWAEALHAPRSKKWLQAVTHGRLTDQIIRSEALTNLGKKKLNKKRHRDMMAAQMKATARIPAPFRPLTDEEMAEIRSGAETFLATKRDGTPLDLMSFGVIVARAPLDGGLRGVRARLETEVRLQQMQQITVPLPTMGHDLNPKTAWCSLNGVLPSAAGEEKGGKPISASVARRRTLGREAKTGFYRQILQQGTARAIDRDIETEQTLTAADALLKEGGALCGGFADDFQTLTSSPPLDAAPSVRGSMAVVSMDGNAFGRIRTEVAKVHGDTGLLAFSAWLEDRKALLMAAILQWIAADPQRRMAGEVAAFEVLMWGGDELEFAMPGWVGWDFALMLCDELESWVSTWTKTALSFGVGVAFGKAKTPIRVLRNAARELSDEAKAASREQTLFRIAAFESVDTVAMSARACREARHGSDLCPSALALPVASVREAAVNAAALYQHVGYSGLVRFMSMHYSALLETEAPDAGLTGLADDWTALLARVGHVAEGAEGPSPCILPGLDAAGPNVWHGLMQGLMLRDYMPLVAAERAL